MGSKGGRPTKLTEALEREILTLIEAGNYIQDAVMACGVAEKTYYNWMERGKKDEAAGKSTVYTRFLQAAMCARARARCHHVGLILRNSEQGRNASASIEYLARTDPAHWGRKDLIVSKGMTADLTSGQVTASAGVAGANGAANKLWEELSKDDWLAEYGRTLEDLGLLDVAAAKADGGAEADAQVDRVHPDSADAEAGDLSYSP